MMLNAPTIASTVPAKTAHPVGPDALVLMPSLLSLGGPRRGRLEDARARAMSQRLGSQRLLLELFVLPVVDDALAGKLVELRELVRRGHSCRCALCRLGLS